MDVVLIEGSDVKSIDEKKWLKTPSRWETPS